MASRIKGLRRKQSDGFEPLIPFGTDGILVDMASGLDNEIEIKLGGNHTSTIIESIVQNESVTTITEKYKDKNNIIDIYSKITTITEHSNGSATIVSAIYSGSDTTATPLNIKTITIPSSDAVDFTIREELN